MRASRVVLALILCSSALLLFAGICAAQQEDAEGCKDYPLFSRMKSFYIDTCETKFDAFEFYVSEEETKTVEGQKTVISYYIREGQNPPSELQIRRNYANAVKSLGGAVLYDSDTYASFKLTVKGQEIWMSVRTSDYGGSYELAVVEVGDMIQEVTANDMLAALNKDGFMALYINFDTGQAVIKPESQSIVDQMAVLLNDNSALRLSVEGHTDNVGNAASNKTLSEQRAKAVMAALVDKGIVAGRLSAAGWGSEKPIADNRSEDGRAKNRRVEIVKK